MWVLLPGWGPAEGDKEGEMVGGQGYRDGLWRWTEGSPAGS